MNGDIILIILGTIFSLMFLFILMIAISLQIDKKYEKMKKEEILWIYRRGK